MLLYVSVVYSFFYCWIIPLHRYNTVLFISSSLDKYLGCFQFLAIVDADAINIFVYMFWWAYAFFFLGLMPGSEGTGSQFKNMLNYIR